MNRLILPLVLLLTLFNLYGLSGVSPDDPGSSRFYINEQDTLKDNQLLYNGIYWRNKYYKVKEDQFLFSKDFLKGSVAINGKVFKDLDLRYDIYNDQIMTPTSFGMIIQLNKELTDSFTINFDNKIYRFTKVESDSVRGFNGFVNVLYKGKVALYVKYRKEIDLLAVDKKYDEFYQVHRIFFVKDDVVYPISRKGDLLKLMNENKEQIKSAIKKFKVKITKKEPESFIPVVRYYDSLSQ
jgi:hypothetical protein